jgi:histidinol-phosphate phosphatase family protein
VSALRKTPAVFLDRDGTLITERGYLSDPARIRFYANVAAGLRRLQKAGFKLVVITNQSGVARGYFSLATLGAIHRRFRAVLASRGVHLAGIYFCPHAPDAGCACRKPKPALPRRAARDLGLDLTRSYVIGDQDRDLGLAAAIGAKGVLVLTGGGRLHRNRAQRSGAKITSNVSSASRWIVRDFSRRDAIRPASRSSKRNSSFT